MHLVFAAFANGLSRFLTCRGTVEPWGGEPYGHGLPVHSPVRRLPPYSITNVDLLSLLVTIYIYIYNPDYLYIYIHYINIIYIYILYNPGC